MEVLPKEEQARLIELAAQGDLAAQNLLVESNLGLAYYKAFQIWSASSRKVKEACDLEDLKQEALLALIIASRHVQPNAGTFTRYAYFHIRKSVAPLKLLLRGRPPGHPHTSTFERVWLH